MGRHAAFDELVSTIPGQPPRRRGRRRGRIVVLVVALLAVSGAGAAAVYGPHRLLDAIPLANSSSCTPIAVRVTVAPSAADTVRRMLGPLQQPARNHDCVQAGVEPQDAAETVAGSAVLPPDRAPDLWIPDSSLWVARVPRWPAIKVGSLGSSPVVLATSRRVVDSRGWSRSAPSWAQVFGSGQPVALPSPVDHVESLVSLTSLWQSLGGGKRADQAVIGAELLAARTTDLDPATALVMAQADAATAPLVPASEQAVFATNRTLSGSGLTAVYPVDGSPALDYPVLRIGLPATGSATVSARRRAAIDAVVARLTSPDALSLAASDGFRQSGSAGPKSAGVSPGPVKLLPAPSGQDMLTVLSRIATLAKPPRMLALVDVSLSMSARLPGGVTRIELAAAAAGQGVDLLPDKASVGVWVFSTRIGGSHNFVELTPTQPLGTQATDGHTHRDQVHDAIKAAIGKLKPGGTPLYDSVLAAVRAQRHDYDPTSVNSVVLFTDGANSGFGGISLTTLVRTLQQEADPQRPVAVFGIGIGPDVDTSALKQIAQATHGRSYQVNSPSEIRAALLDGLSTRPVSSAG
jgi:Ca-activated chloride channel homolog